MKELNSKISIESSFRFSRSPEFKDVGKLYTPNIKLENDRTKQSSYLFIDILCWTDLGGRYKNIKNVCVLVKCLHFPFLFWVTKLS